MRTSTRGANIELRLAAVPADGPPVDVVVEAAPDVPARDLLDRVSEATGVDLSDARLGGESVLADAPVSELALQWGDELCAVDGSGSSLAPVELLVEGGPDAGRRCDEGLQRIRRGRREKVGREVE